MMDFSTIAAISTPRGKGGVALLRVSGTEAVQISQKIFVSASGKSICEYPPRHQIYGRIIEPNHPENVLDDVLLTYFSSPNSFTGEDVVEIACHGGEVITALILNTLIRAGATPAMAGEFTRRAFINGKVSLTAAEGIADLLDAKTESAALLSSKTARGKLSEKIGQISDQILKVASTLWAYLDYPEEDLGELDDSQMLSELNLVISECNRLVQSFEMGKAVTSGVPVAIVGKPNVGKSSFFNAFLGEEKAIVTDIPGTTRDVIEYPARAGRVLIHLADTAGLRKNGADVVEEIGMEKALKTAQDADLVFGLFDLSRPFEDDDRDVLDFLKENSKESKVVLIFTKKDLPCQLELSHFDSIPNRFEVSFASEFDLSPILNWVENQYISDESAYSEGAIVTNLRQKGNLQKATGLLEEASLQIERGEKDIASLTIESALSALMEVDGKTAGEKILNEVFSRFCIGK